LTKILSVIGWYPNPFEDPPPIPYLLPQEQKNERLKKGKPPTKKVKREKLRVMIAPEGNEAWSPDSDDYTNILFQGEEKHPQIAGKIYTLLETVEPAKVDQSDWSWRQMFIFPAPTAPRRSSLPPLSAGDRWVCRRVPVWSGLRGMP
jgi:hypothetical protein